MSKASECGKQERIQHSCSVVSSLYATVCLYFSFLLLSNFSCPFRHLLSCSSLHLALFFPLSFVYYFSFCLFLSVFSLFCTVSLSFLPYRASLPFSLFYLFVSGHPVSMRVIAVSVHPCMNTVTWLSERTLCTSAKAELREFSRCPVLLHCGCCVGAVGDPNCFKTFFNLIHWHYEN